MIEDVWILFWFQRVWALSWFHFLFLQETSAQWPIWRVGKNPRKDIQIRDPKRSGADSNPRTRSRFKIEAEQVPRSWGEITLSYLSHPYSKKHISFSIVWSEPGRTTARFGDGWTGLPGAQKLGRLGGACERISNPICSKKVALLHHEGRLGVQQRRFLLAPPGLCDQSHKAGCQRVQLWRQEHQQGHLVPLPLGLHRGSWHIKKVENSVKYFIIDTE